MKHSRIVITTIAVLAMFFWGMSFVWSKIVFRYYSPLTTILVRLVLSSLLLWLIRWIFIRNEKIIAKDILLFLLSSFFSPFCYFIGESYGLAKVSSTIASVIVATIPVVTPFVAYLTLREHLSRMNFAGVVISFIGVLIMLLKKDLSFSASLSGVGLLFFAVISAIGYAVIIKTLAQKYHPITVVTVQNSIGALYFLPWFLYFDWSHFITVRPNQELITSLIALVVFASSMAFILFTAAVKSMGVARANIYTNLIPVFTVIFSYWMLSESVTLGKISGMAVVIFGVVLAQWDRLKNSQ